MPRLALLATTALLLGACGAHETNLTAEPAPGDAAAGGDADGPGAPPCVLGGTTTLRPATVACAQNATGRLVLDDQYVYWTVQHAGDVVVRAPLGGGATETLARASVGAVGLVVVGGYAYYTLPGLGRVMRVSFAGGLPDVVASGLDVPIFLATDGAALYVTGGQQDAGVILKVALPTAGDGRTRLPVTLIDGQARPRGVAVAGGYVYWTDFSAGAVLRTADHVDASAAGGVHTAVRLAAGLEGPSDLALRGGYAYVADQAGRVVRVPLAGGDLEVVADAHGTPYGLATDGVSVYWTTLGAGGVFRAPLAGGAAISLVTGELDPHFLAVNADTIYWGAWGAGGVVKRFGK